LGISPTSYDVPDNLSSAIPPTLPLLVPPRAEEECVIFEKESELQHFPTLFDRLSVWEEATRLDLERAAAAEPPNSPQKSITDSCSSMSQRSNASSVRSMRSSTIRLFGGGRKSTDSMESTKRKAKEIVNRSRGKVDSASSSSNSGVWRRSLSPATIKSTDSSSTVATDASSTSSSRVKIFLLLLEPRTKMFELIQLVYPRKTTKVEDLLNMIPKDATEPALANQTYVGITRPKRRSEPVTDLGLWASNHVLATTDQTAGIVHGEVIVAIPANTLVSHIVSLSKQILASGHIQTLISKSGGSSIKSKSTGGSSASQRRSQERCELSGNVPNANVDGEQGCGRSSSPPRRFVDPDGVAGGIAANCHSNTSPRSSRKQRPEKYGGDSVDSDRTGTTNSSHASTTPISPKTPLGLKSRRQFQSFTVHQLTENERPPPADLHGVFFHGYKDDDRESVVNQSLSVRLPGRTPFFSENIFVGGTAASAERRHDVEYSTDMLNAYLSKEAAKNICEITTDECDLAMATSRSLISATDDMSLDDGSLTSTFQHWSQSLRNDGMWLHEEETLSVPGSVVFGSSRKQFKKQCAAAAGRLGILAVLASIARYYSDPAGLAGSESRQHVFEVPMGCWGGVQFLFCFLILIKVQRILQPLVSRRPSKCPAMLLMAQMYESRYGRPTGQTKAIYK
jgi:hypothetical protein